LSVRNEAAGVLVRRAACHGLDHIEVVLHLVKRAILRKSIEKRAN